MPTITDELAAIRRQLYSIEVRMDRLLVVADRLVAVVSMSGAELEAMRGKLKAESDSLEQSLEKGV